MPSIAYDVDVVLQEQNPICWVASCAMVKGYGLGTSIGVAEFTGGADPSTSSIPNPADDWGKCTDLMTQWGFDVVSVLDVSPTGLMTPEALLSLLSDLGPAVLLHTCEGFPYGSQYAPLPATAAHAVVITALDTDQNAAWFNNPWGDKDQSCGLDEILTRINTDQIHGKSLGFWRG